MRKYKQVKEKNVTFDMQEWAEVERRASVAGLKTESAGATAVYPHENPWGGVYRREPCFPNPLG